jgi:hypothetical protein
MYMTAALECGRSYDCPDHGTARCDPGQLEGNGAGAAEDPEATTSLASVCRAVDVRWTH